MNYSTNSYTEIDKYDYNDVTKQKLIEQLLKIMSLGFDIYII